MDARVKPGHGDWARVIVIAGLDPAIHHCSKRCHF